MKVERTGKEERVERADNRESREYTNHRKYAREIVQKIAIYIQLRTDASNLS